MIYIGLDIGSTAVKAVAIDESGNILAKGSSAYPTFRDGVCVTQDARDWWTASVNALRSVTEQLEHPEYTVAISTSSQGGSVLALNAKGEPICSALTWMDSRSTLEAKALSEKFGDGVYRKCGWRTSSIDSSAKLTWVRKNMPDVWKNAAKFVTTEEYINLQLCGRLVTDPTGAAMMRFYNINTGCWDKELCDYVGVGNDQLAEVCPAGTYIGNLTSDTARAVGLTENVKVYCGAHDQYCSSIGSGVVNKGDILLATGTAWVLFGVTDKLVYNDKHVDPGIHPVNGRCGVMCSLGGLGAALEDYSDKAGVSLRDIDNVAKDRRENAKDLLCCPDNKGKFFVSHKEGTLGAMLGKTDKHDLYDISLALMEAAAFNTYVAVDEFKSAGIIDNARLTMAGGASKSSLWRSVVASLMGGISINVEHDTPTLGAAMIASVSDSAFNDYTDCSAVFVKKVDIEAPDRGICDFYKEKLYRYRKWCIL